MHRPAAALQTCIDHQWVALKTLRQRLESERCIGPDQPSPEQPSPATRHPPGPPHSRRTIAHMARESKLSRFVDLTSELTAVEQRGLCPLPEPHFFPVELKLSVELRNICVRLATRKDGFQLDGDLKEIEDCLMNIVNQLLLSLSLYNSESHLQATEMLKGFLKKFPDRRNHLESSFYCS
ncbi:leukemia-associated protein 7-like [Callorhinchus milii]|nr:leukemia-associated protein 7-like [Callorhinchus milii]